jgi:hypothetical protein
MQLALEDKKRSIILSEEKTIKSHSEDPVRTDEVKGLLNRSTTHFKSHFHPAHNE